MYTFYNKEGSEIDMDALLPVIKKDLDKALSARIEAKKLEDDAEKIVEKAKEQFETMFVLLEDSGVVKVKVDGLGSISREDNKPKDTLNKDLLKELLIAKGLSAVVVKNCFDKATKKGKVNEPFKYVYRR